MLEEEVNPRRRLPRHLRPAPPTEAPFSFTLRSAVVEDLPYVLEIYNHYVLNSTVTFDEEPQTLAELRARFERIEKLGHPFIVAVSPSGQVLGFAYVHPWKAKAAYRFTVENTIYVGPAATGKGLGRALMAELLTRAKAAGIKEVVAVIADHAAEGSLALHRAFGFTETGHLGRVGFKFGRWLGTVLMQKSL